MSSRKVVGKKDGASVAQAVADGALDDVQGGAVSKSYAADRFNLMIPGVETGFLSSAQRDALSNAKK